MGLARVGFKGIFDFQACVYVSTPLDSYGLKLICEAEGAFWPHIVSLSHTLSTLSLSLSLSLLPFSSSSNISLLTGFSQSRLIVIYKQE